MSLNVNTVSAQSIMMVIASVMIFGHRANGTENSVMRPARAVTAASSTAAMQILSGVIMGVSKL